MLIELTNDVFDMKQAIEIVEGQGIITIRRGRHTVGLYNLQREDFDKIRDALNHRPRSDPHGNRDLATVCDSPDA